MVELKVTELGTINGWKKNGISINSFLKELNKMVDNLRLDVDDELYDNISFQATVSKKNDHYNITTGGYRNYSINANLHPYLDEKLSKLVKKCEYRDLIKEKYHNLNDDIVDTKQDKEYALKFLKMIRKESKKNLLINVLKFLGILLSCPISLALIFLSIYVESILLLIFSSVLITAALTLSFGMLITGIVGDEIDGKFPIFNSIIKYIRYNHLNKKMTRKLERMVGKSYSDKKSNHKETISSNSITEAEINQAHGNGMIGYMYNIRDNAKKLKKTDSERILLQLSDILDEYTDRCKKFNQGSDLKFTSMQSIMAETLDKLTTLEEEINRLLIQKNRYVANEQLRNDLDKDLEGVLSSSGGKGSR